MEGLHGENPLGHKAWFGWKSWPTARRGRPRPDPMARPRSPLALRGLIGHADGDPQRLRLRRLRHAHRQHSVLELSDNVRWVHLLGELQLAAPATPRSLLPDELALNVERCSL